jgi:cytochrome d ubiquinol oxidase subunit I
MARFWTKIFAVNFAMGVASGIVMEFQFGTNWSTYSRFVGDIFGSALAAEGIFAFFLESGFLAVLVFGWDKVSPKMHFFSALMVSLGSIFSAVWIVIANSWQQTPAGFRIVGEGLAARAQVTDFWEMVFNPSSMDRLAHTLIGAFIMGGFFVMSVMAYYILKGRHVELAKRSFVIALLLASVSAWAALLTGHKQAARLPHTQPAKLAAFEGLYTTEPSARMTLFGIPDSETKTVKWQIAIPGLLSFLVHGDFNKPVQGLDQFPRKDWPPVGVSFQSYHGMVALGTYFLFITSLSLFFWWRGTLFEKRWLMRMYVWSVLGAVAANQLGWVAAEVGRQPWIVYGLLRTADGLSKVVEASQVLGSIVMFGLIYAMLLAVWIFVVNNKIKGGPEETHLTPKDKRSDGGPLLARVAEMQDPSKHSRTDANKP